MDEQLKSLLGAREIQLEVTFVMTPCLAKAVNRTCDNEFDFSKLWRNRGMHVADSSGRVTECSKGERRRISYFYPGSPFTSFLPALRCGLIVGLGISWHPLSLEGGTNSPTILRSFLTYLSSLSFVTCFLFFWCLCSLDFPLSASCSLYLHPEKTARS